MMTQLLNKALPVHHTATTEEPWDGPAAVAAMPAKASVLQYCHAWQDSASVDPDTDDEDNDADDKKSNYRFPHHKTKGGPANLNACRNGLARLPDSKIPEGDKAGVRKHLQAHLDDAKNGTENRFQLPKAVRNWREAQNKRLASTESKNDWYKITNAASSQAEVMLYGDIGGFWGIESESFVRDLNAISASKINLRVDSDGGSVFDALTIHTALKAHPAYVTAYIEGTAASAASFICMAANKVVIARNAQIMIHDAMTVCTGNAADFREIADWLDQQSNNIADIYSQKAGGDPEDWRDLMKSEKWYIGQDAVNIGLADEVGIINTPASNNSTLVVDEFTEALPEGFFLEALTNAFKGGSQ